MAQRLHDQLARTPRFRQYLDSAKHISPGWWFAAWTAFCLGAASGVWIQYPDWLAPNESGSTTLRNVSLFLGGAIGLPLAAWRSYVAGRQADAAHRQSQTATRQFLNDRFQRAAEMLGSGSESVRLGGIYTLADLSRKEADTFYEQAMQLLAAFIVDRTRDNRQSGPDETARSPGDPSGVSTTKVNIPDGRAEYLQPYLRLRATIRIPPQLPKDVEEALKAIAQRADEHVALESDHDLRLNLAHASVDWFAATGANFARIDFTKASLCRTKLWRARLTDAVLAGADLSGADLSGADLRNADMRRVNLTAANLVGANLGKVDLGLVDKASENLWKGTIFPSVLIGALMPGVDLRGANLSRADLRGASLGGAKLDNADLSTANLAGADLRGASLHGAELTAADLRNANLNGIGADLTDAKLDKANLSGAMLGGATLTKASLAETDLSGADFANEWQGETRAPAVGLTQDQLDQAKADPAKPPILVEVRDSVTTKPLVWKGPQA